MLKRSIAGLFALLLSGSGLLWAEGWTVGVHPGYSLPIGNAADLIEGSPVLHLSLDCDHDEAWSYGVEAGYAFGHPLEGEDDFDGSLPMPVHFSSDIDLTQFHVTPVIRWRKTVESGGATWTPNATFGAGWYQSPAQTGTIELHTQPPQMFAAELDADSDFGINIGGGIGLGLTEKFNLGLDLRYHHRFESGDDTQFIVPTLRLNFSF